MRQLLPSRFRYLLPLLLRPLFGPGPRAQPSALNATAAAAGTPPSGAPHATNGVLANDLPPNDLPAYDLPATG